MTVTCSLCGVWTCSSCGWQRHNASLTFDSHDCYRCGSREGELVPSEHRPRHHHLFELVPEEFRP